MLSDDVWRHLPAGPLPVAVVGVVGLGLLLLVAAHDTRGTRRLAAVLLALATATVLAMTLTGGTPSLGAQVNLRPGAGIRSELTSANGALGLLNTIGNVLVFVPIGWLAAVLALRAAQPWRAVALGTLAGAVLSAAIEVTQYSLGRVADVDDLLLNATGAALGALLGTALARTRRA